MKTTLALGALLLGSATARTSTKKIVEFRTKGEDGEYSCPDNTQDLQIEGFDYNTNVRMIMTWRQVAGPCGAEIEGEPGFWRGYFNETDDHPEENFRMQLDMYMCAPYGQYELDLDVTSYNGNGFSRIAWEIERAPDEYHIWDTLNPRDGLTNDYSYAPRSAGEYTWPLEGETGWYKTFIAGPLPPIECSYSVPDNTQHEGCFEDDPDNSMFQSGFDESAFRGPDGMTTHICSDFCIGYDYFGLSDGSKCHCGTAEEFEGASSAPGKCGSTFETVCRGDPTTACGGVDAINVYSRTDGSGPTSTPPTSAPPTPASPTSTPSTDYEEVGCYQDSNTDEGRVMEAKYIGSSMSAEICFARCTDLSSDYNYFGTQFSSECWCATDPDLTLYGSKLADSKCNKACAGNSSEACGGKHKLTVYKIVEASSPTPTPEPTPDPTPAPTPEQTSESTSGGDEFSAVGCYKDTPDRIMGDSYVAAQTPMNAQICYDICKDEGDNYTHFGTEFGQECWCGVDPNLTKNRSKYKTSRCNTSCAGDSIGEFCGGRNKMSVYVIN